jgi:hypothetical protein
MRESLRFVVFGAMGSTVVGDGRIDESTHLDTETRSIVVLETQFGDAAHAKHGTCTSAQETAGAVERFEHRFGIVVRIQCRIADSCDTDVTADIQGTDGDADEAWVFDLAG